MPLESSENCEWTQLDCFKVFLSSFCHLQSGSGKKRDTRSLCDASLAEQLQDSQDRWPIRIGWLKRELNLMPHFLSEMRQALWLDLSQKDLSPSFFYTSHPVISHIAVSLKPKIISTHISKGTELENPIWNSCDVVCRPDHSIRAVPRVILPGIYFGWVEQ